MSKPRPSIFRDALQVSCKRIAAMNDEELSLLMAQLLHAQAYRCDSPINELQVSTEAKAKDDGCDAWSAKPARPDAWLGSTDTCWQFKAGLAGEPARLASEVTKRIPKQTLTSGGRFVLVASGLTNSTKGKRDRLKRLTSEAAATNIPTERIEVIGSDQLARWCNQHPAVAAYWSGRPDGLCSLDEWLRYDEHQAPWQASDAVQAELEDCRADLDFIRGNVYHLHIHGPPGVGKSRRALELCRGAPWSHAVIYIRQADDVRLTELIGSAAADAGVQLLVVADEAQPDKLRALRDSLDRDSGRIRLITVGHSPTPDPSRIHTMEVKPLEEQSMRRVVKGWYPAMPPEHVDFVVRFADGYPRLARLAAEAVVKSPTMDVRGLLSRHEIRSFLDGMLGEGKRRTLYVVAALSRVGWTEDIMKEGEAVSRHLGLDWNQVRATVKEYDDRLGIAPRGGRYRYISPMPLGIHLAVDAWNTYPDLMKSLVNALPSEMAKDAYYERLSSMSSNPEARTYARKELSRFSRIDDFVDARAVRRWSALSSADVIEAARKIRRILYGATIEERKRIEGQAKRELVWTLVRFAWKQSSFHDAAMALALLAESVNEPWDDSAAAEFANRFLVFLGGTAVPYLDRLSVLDELLAQERPPLARLAVQALARVGEQHTCLLESSPASDELRERQWAPRTWGEVFECERTAVTKLSDIARRGLDDIQDDLVAAAKNLSMMLRNRQLRASVTDFFDAVRTTYPGTREHLRRAIAEVISGESKYLKELSIEEVAELKTIHARFEDPSLEARLQQFVGHVSWEPEEQPDLRPLAREILSAPHALEANWPWLTSGDASSAWRLGGALAEVDTDGRLAEVFPLLPGGGRDLRMLCEYVCVKRRALGDDWYDTWVTSQMDRTPKPIELLFEVAWRCGITASVAKIVIATLRGAHVDPQLVGHLGYGSWGDKLSPDDLETVLQSMADTGHRQTAIAILANHIKHNPTNLQRWKTLALDLVTAPEAIRSNRMTAYSWQHVATALVPDHSKEIAAAILREQGDRSSATWFAENKGAAGILRACVEQDPSGVWKALQPYLASAAAHRFCIGFPRGLLERMPSNDVESWIAENPEKRASIVARLISKDMSTDETMASRILGKYADNERVASAFFSDYVSGPWVGPESSHSEDLARSLDAIASRTALSKLRRWAFDSARSLRETAEHERQREQEEELRWR